ncbi:PEP-CTERM sorting domain-containing protein [Mariniblastus fucicola]|uniref:Ice-binding protein C-terminal domain-containing protein n=1 Tax=Mariniblastus fucicola TaxID=980251 RepID=A0A5B9P919_9BACT|nr:PEP-CTERM sorting domain-containing protein [Mariniblastus fucicola]QEG22798.1 hypothetical protein MFFC18_26820 [Mariniblastus fucicola]
MIKSQLLVRSMPLAFLAFVCVTINVDSLLADVQGSTSNNATVTIPDANVGGVPISASTITITQNEIIEQATFTIEGLSHEFAGDLVAIVRHVESDTATALFSRVGKSNPNLGVGDESNFEGDYDFSDATNNDLWAEAAIGSTDYEIRSKSDATMQNPGVYRASAGVSGAPISLNGVFAGLSTQGTWRLELSDRNSTVVGSFEEFSVDFVTAVPEPSAMGLVLAGVALLGVRRRRRQTR